MSELSNSLINTPVNSLGGKRRMIKAIARALVWTDAYYGMESEVRYATAEQLYNRGVRILDTKKSSDYREVEAP